jgi:lysozyme family protein
LLYNKDDISKRFATMVINSGRLAEIEAIAKRLMSHQDRYKKVQELTGVPWQLVAALHEREASGSFRCYLGNGEPLNQVTKAVPAGRGPWFTWEDGAVDALKFEGFDKETDWCMERMLFLAEKFNGPGYANKGLPSPYVWGATNQQRRGKFTIDHGFNSDMMDVQIGVAPLLKLMTTAEKKSMNPLSLIGAILNVLVPTVGASNAPVTGAGTTVSPITTITNAIGMVIGAILAKNGVDNGTATAIGGGVAVFVAALLNQLHITGGANVNTVVKDS